LGSLVILLLKYLDLGGGGSQKFPPKNWLKKSQGPWCCLYGRRKIP